MENKEELFKQHEDFINSLVIKPEELSEEILKGCEI